MQRDALSSGPVRLTRRTALGAGLAGSVLGVTGLPSTGWARAPVVAAAIYDRRFPQAEAFAQRAQAQAIPSLGFAEDMTRSWFDGVAPRLRDSRTPVIGMTDARALFCFEQLAWDLGMRVRLRIDHLQSEAAFVHVSTNALPAAALARLDAAGGAFGGCAADLALASRPVWGDCTHASSPHEAAAEVRLVTWAIAPLRSA